MNHRKLYLIVLFCLLFLTMRINAKADTRVLLVGVGSFVSEPSTETATANNVQLMRSLFENADPAPILIAQSENNMIRAEQLTALIANTFASAGADDLSIVYVCTHGVYDSESRKARLLLSDGLSEGCITPAELEEALQAIGGTKLLMLDACASGAFIGKGLPADELPWQLCFRDSDIKVLTSSGAMEKSWYWSDSSAPHGGARQGAFYFTQALADGMSDFAGYPADRNRDGEITLSELYAYLVLNHAASTPQVYPQEDDTVIFRYNASRAALPVEDRAPVMNVSFTSTYLTHSQRMLSMEYTVTRPVRIAYQIVYFRNGAWDFANARIIYDGAERSAFSANPPGSVSAGYKLRSLLLSENAGDESGHVLVQLLSIEQQHLRVHAGRAIAILPTGEVSGLQVAVSPTFDPSKGEELCISVAHEDPCLLSVSIVDETGGIIRRLCHKQASHPASPDCFYWNGLGKDGSLVSSGTYYVQVKAFTETQDASVLSDGFVLISSETEFD